MGNALGEDFDDDGALAGMKGTTPLTELGAGLHATGSSRSTPTSQDFNYAGESYDAVVITALAAADGRHQRRQRLQAPTSTA